MAIDYDKYIYSKTIHYISNSGKDEKNRYHGGKAGDQTGHEWELKKWYSRPWSCVLRYPDDTVGLYIAKLSIEAALNDNVGYDQDQRGTYWTELKKANYKPSAIKTKCEDDCTSGVSANVKAVGAILGLPKLENLPLCSSRNMKKEFIDAGFMYLTGSRYTISPDYLLPGDILLYEGHHAAANVTFGKKVVTPTLGEEVEITGKTVWIRKAPGVENAAVGIAHKGEKYKFAAEYDPKGNGWYGIKYKENVAYVSAKYSRII